MPSYKRVEVHILYSVADQCSGHDDGEGESDW